MRNEERDVGRGEQRPKSTWEHGGGGRVSEAETTGKTVSVYMLDFRRGNGTGVYIGASVEPEKRWRKHLNELRRGKHSNPDVQFWYDELGEDAVRFQTLYETVARSPDEVCRLEETWMSYAVDVHGRDNVLNVYLKSHRGSFASAFQRGGHE